MATLLRDHVAQMRDLIRAGKPGQALALGSFALRSFPKDIQVYRLMGEAALELADADSAADLFRRVLSGDPENLVAHLGLAFIAEERKDLDEAAQYYQRAWDLAPANGEVRAEYARLVRLRGAAGLGPVKMTSAGLVRLKMEQEAYAQALPELEALARADPSRWDLRVLLAETYFRTGQLHECTETAQKILAELPYCLKANVLLGATWVESGLSEGQVYLERAQALDPSNEVAATLLGSRSPLKPAQPTLRPEGAAGETGPSLPPATELIEGAAVVGEQKTDSGTAVDWTPSAEKWPSPIAAPEPQVTAETEPAPLLPPIQVQAPAETALPAERPPVPLSRVRPQIPGVLEKMPPWLRALIPPAQAPATGLPAEVEPAAPVEPVPSAPVPEWLNRVEPTVSLPSPEPAQSQSRPEMEPAGEGPVPVGGPEPVVPPIAAGEHGLIREDMAAASPLPAAPEAPVTVGSISEEQVAEAVSAGLPPSEPAPAVQPLPVPEPEPAPAAAAMLAPEPESPLARARSLLDKEDAPALTEAYEYVLFHSPDDLNAVIGDLEALSGRGALPNSARRVLADAYAMAGRYKESVEQYRLVVGRAEK